MDTFVTHWLITQDMNFYERDAEISTQPQYKGLYFGSDSVRKEYDGGTIKSELSFLPLNFFVAL